jgi:anti-sigma factor (TIGR02949 family)
MKDCDAFRRLISPFLDGELVGEDCAAFEEHVAACGSCRASLAEERAVVAAVKDALPLYEAPERLREAVTGLLSARPVRRIPWVAIAAGLAGAVAGTVWLTRSAPPAPGEPQPASEFASLAARTHLRYTQGQLPLEVNSDRAEEVSRWFAGRVPFRLALPDYPVGPGKRKSYRLAGGRLVSFKNDTAAFAAYRMEDRPISLLVTSASLVRPAGGDVVPSGNLLFHIESVDGFKVITWTDNGLTYALASDLDVEGARSCLVCHGSPEERRKVEPLARVPASD